MPRTRGRSIYALNRRLRARALEIAAARRTRSRSVPWFSPPRRGAGRRFGGSVRSASGVDSEFRRTCNGAQEKAAGFWNVHTLLFHVHLEDILISWQPPASDHTSTSN